MIIMTRNYKGLGEEKAKLENRVAMPDVPCCFENCGNSFHRVCPAWSTHGTVEKSWSISSKQILDNQIVS